MPDYNPPSSGGAAGPAGGVMSGTYPNPGFAAAPTFIGPVTITGTANASALASSGHSVTGSGTTSMFNFTGTWNTSGAPTAFLMNITKTAASSASLLFDFQIGGASKIKGSQGGILTTASDVISGGALAAASTNYIGWGSRVRMLASTTILDVFQSDQTTQAYLRALLRTSANAVTGLSAGALALLTNASVVLYDGSGQAYRVPCII